MAVPVWRWTRCLGRPPYSLSDGRRSRSTRGSLERAAVRVCREAGARVATNVLLRDMNVDVPLANGRRIEVLANGLALWQGAQAAVDTTLVSRGQRLNRRRNANASTHTRSWRSRQLARARARESPARLRPAVQRASLHRWQACWLWRRNARCLARSLNFFFSHTFLRLRTSGSLCKATYVVRAGRRLLTGACNQRASASSSCKAGGSPAAPSSAAGGSSRSEAAKARCAATERMPLQRCTQAA